MGRLRTDRRRRSEFLNLALISLGRAVGLCYYKLYPAPMARMTSGAAPPLLPHPHPDERLAAALFRLLAAEQGFAAAGLLAIDGELCRLVAATPSLAAYRRDSASGEAWALPAAARTGKPSRIAPGALSLAAGFAALAPVTGADGRLAGLVLVADRRVRRMSSALTIRLADAAVLARPAFPRAPRSAPTPTMPTALGRTVLRTVVRPRAAAHRFVESALRARRPTGPFGLMIIDIDRFRAVNEAMGVAAGDAFLAVTGIRLAQTLGPGDRLVRIEGDRFLVVAAPRSCRTARPRPAAAAGGRPAARPRRRHGGDAGEHRHRARAPATTSPLAPADARRDRAAPRQDRGPRSLRAARAGRGGPGLEKSRLELDLASAVDDGQLHLVYQPYVDLRDGRVSGAEALMRWDHPLRGELPPAAFIPLAEATGRSSSSGAGRCARRSPAPARGPRRCRSRSTSRRCSSTSRAFSPRSTPRSPTPASRPSGSSSRSPRPC